jgi:hypothetical protein
MKTSTGIILLAAAGAAYLMLRKDGNGGGSMPHSDNFNPISAGTVTPTGNTITEPINSPREGVDYINKHILNKIAAAAASRAPVPVNTKTVLPSGVIHIKTSKEALDDTKRSVMAYSAAKYGAGTGYLSGYRS